MGLFVQKPVGVWAETGESRALWAILQCKTYIRRVVAGERSKEKAWAKKLAKLIDGPVRSYDWTGWLAANEPHGQLFRDDSSRDVHDEIFQLTIPSEILAAWEKVPDAVQQLWLQAAEVRCSAEGLPFDAADLDAALATVGEQIAGITANLRDQLEGMMRVAMQEHEGQFGFASRLRQEWGDLSKARSNLIAVTEWNRAASAATHIAYVRQGVQQLIWLTAGDERVCPVCEDNSAEGAVPISEGFPSGDLYPPAHPGCRCNIAAA